MNPQTAKNAIQFLNRTQIQGAEAPAFMQVLMELERAANPAPGQGTDTGAQKPPPSSLADDAGNKPA